MSHGRAGRDENGGDGIHGVVDGPCPNCRATIPKDTLVCPGCEYRRRFSQEHYDMLVRCAQDCNTAPWNDWREADPATRVLLEAADLAREELWGVNLAGAWLLCASLEGTELLRADLTGAYLRDANLQGADLTAADLTRANLYGARLARAKLMDTDLVQADLRQADLSLANLGDARLPDAQLGGACLADASLPQADLSGARLHGVDMQGMDAIGASVSGRTRIRDCLYDRWTDFSDVGLAGACIEGGLRAALERNVRRIGWEDWYRAQPWLLRWPVRVFWWTSDYGSSSGRVLLALAFLSALFAALYYWRGLVAPPGLVTNLFWADGVAVPHLLAPLRALYFSVVTMTTLGFGDVNAEPTSYLGHVLLMVQVALGYVLLGALITRFAIMFQGGAVPGVPGDAYWPLRWWDDLCAGLREGAQCLRSVPLWPVRVYGWPAKALAEFRQGLFHRRVRRRTRQDLRQSAQ
jgi:uncharacterized protein YjbI with pentapeptide repeats